LLSSPGGQALLLPGLALQLIKNFVSLRQDGPADAILIPRLTQSRFIGRNCRHITITVKKNKISEKIHYFGSNNENYKIKILIIQLS
jgi:hypothetical protein